MWILVFSWKLKIVKGGHLVCRVKLIANNKAITLLFIDDQAVTSKDDKYLCCNIGYQYLNLDVKFANFQYLCGTMKKILLGKTRIETMLKFCKVMAALTLPCKSECWTFKYKPAKIIRSSRGEISLICSGIWKTWPNLQSTHKGTIKYFHNRKRL
jgi:hypothetical protein